VEQLTTADRACAVAAAAAHDLNNELTVILNSVNEALDTIHSESPARGFLLELQAAAQRCVFKASGLLNFSARASAKTVRASFEYLIEQ
jgi:signal transduction histidine kinase